MYYITNPRDTETRRPRERKRQHRLSLIFEISIWKKVVSRTRSGTDVFLSALQILYRLWKINGSGK